MVARAFRRMLLIELCIYAACGWYLVRAAAWSPAQALAGAFAWALALRAVLVAASFAISRIYASPTPREHRLGLAAWIRVYLAELGAYILVYNFYQPFEPLLAGEERLQPLASPRLPVLLLHGYVCNRGFMLPLRNFLRAQGITAYTHNLEPIYADIGSYAEALARRIDEICAASGAEKLIIVAHSMGGLAARAYLRRHGARRVAKLVTLGTPHCGTELARFAAGKNARQMEPGNAWLEQLNSTALAVPTLSIFSYQDEIVAPQISGALAGADCSGISGGGHVGLPFSRRVRALLLAALAADALAE